MLNKRGKQGRFHTQFRLSFASILQYLQLIHDNPRYLFTQFAVIYDLHLTSLLQYTVADDLLP